MTIEELRQKCRVAQAAGPKILLVVPGPAPRGDRKRLTGRRGPLGEFVSQGIEDAYEGEEKAAKSYGVDEAIKRARKAIDAARRT